MTHVGEEVLGPLISVRPDLRVPSRIHARVVFSDQPMAFEVALEWDSAELSYLVKRLVIDADGAVSTADLHKVSLPTLIRLAASGDPEVMTEEGDWERFELVLASLDLTEFQSEIAAAGPTDDVLKWVGRIYAWGRIMGGNPNQLVVSTLGLPKRTATRWIARARQIGHLD